MSKRDEVPPAMSWKAFWATLSTLVTAGCALVPWFAGLPGWVAILAQAGAGVGFVVLAAVVVRSSAMFAMVPADGRDQMMTLLRAGAVAHVVWAVAFVIRPHPGWLLVLVALGIAEYWVARGNEYWITRIAKQPIVMPRHLSTDEDRETRIFLAALDEAGRGWLDFLAWAPVGDPDRPFGLSAEVRVPSRMALTRSGEKTTAAGLTQAADAEPIAIALAKVTGKTILSDWIQITKQPAAGTYQILVVTEDVMARVYPYRDPLTSGRCDTPKTIGYGMDGQPVTLRLDQHGQFSGGTQFGKSSLINVEWAELTLCSDAVIWAAGVEKLYDLVAGWIEPYEGHDLPLPIDWIASGQRDLLRMLVAAMTVARWRQRQPMARRRGFTRIFLYLDEASFAMDPRTKELYDGMPYSASELLAMLAKGAASAGVFVKFVSQRGTNGQFGDKGGDVTANAGYVTSFGTRDQADAGRLTRDYGLTPPRHKGEFWLEAGGGPVRVKAPYIQTVDPDKPVRDGCPLVSTVAWDRRHFLRDLDAGSAEAAGEAYAGRHRRMGPALLAYLTGAPAPATTAVVDAPSPSPAVGAGTGHDRAWAEAEALGWLDVLKPAEPAPVGQVLTLAGRRSRAERIVAVIEASPMPLAPAEIRAALSAQDDDASEQVVANALTKLVREGKLSRPRTGMYALRRVT